MKVIKLLVGHQKLRNQIKAISSGEPETPNRFERFLESKNEDDGRTALLISCYYKDYTTVDILIEAGANVAAIDSICMTALTWAALPISRESFILSCPTEKEAPSIYQVIIIIIIFYTSIPYIYRFFFFCFTFSFTRI